MLFVKGDDKKLNPDLIDAMDPSNVDTFANALNY